MAAPRTWAAGPLQTKLCSIYISSQLEAPALTWQHQALMMIDLVVFFITLNPIRACCNLSNDSSLLQSLRASLFYATSRTLWDSIIGSMIFLLLHTHITSSGILFQRRSSIEWQCVDYGYFMDFKKQTCHSLKLENLWSYENKSFTLRKRVIREPSNWLWLFISLWFDQHVIDKKKKKKACQAYAIPGAF